MTLPADVIAMAGRGAEWAAWVERLPGLVRGLVDEWGLVPDGAYRHGHCSLVLPVRSATSAATSAAASAGTSTGDAAVLKLGFPDEDSEHEHLALQHWHGDGAVQLLRADPRRRALLLERAGPDDLTTVDDLAACEIAASSYSRLHRAPLPQLRRLSGLLERWREQLASVPRGAPVPHRMVEHAASIARQLLGEPNTDARLLHGDLHYGQVLRADREPWLVTDPKPLNGDPHFEPAPLLWNRWDEVVSSGDVRGTVRQRFFTVVDTALLDEDRARDFVVLRVVLNAVWELREQAPDRDWITTNIAVAKAVQD